MSKHTTAVILRFDPKGRQSSRRTSTTPPDQQLVKAFERQKAEARLLAKALGVTEKALLANKARLLYHGDVLLAIEAAHGSRLTAGARDAVLGALFSYHDMGYETGLGEVRTARGTR